LSNNKGRANQSSEDQSKHVLPGEFLAAQEEFEAGEGSAVIGGNVIATRIGSPRADMSQRVMAVLPARHDIAKLPQVGDHVSGTVESAASSVAQVKIEAVNEVPSSKELSGMLSLREDRRRGRASPLRAGDVIRAKISSTKNAIYHLVMDDPSCGVIYTVCSFCGGRVIALGHGAIKCTECGATDDRLLSEDFIAYSRGAH
jgi:exosome complex RNA-binding protein Csl4